METNLKNTERVKNVVTVDNCIIKQISSPATISRVATDKGINPQEVYVRVIFSHNGNEYNVSNKLRFLTKAGYEELIKAKTNGTPMKLVVDVESGFFYIEKDVSVDDLFKENTVKTVNYKENLASLLLV